MPTRPKLLLRTLLLATAALGLGATAALAAPYEFLTTIAIPPSPDNTAVSNAGGKFVTYDIADVNPATNTVYLADRSNAAVDLFNSQNLTFAGRIGGSSSAGGSIAFSGQQSSNAVSGPDGVVVAASAGKVFVGNGNSTVYGFSLGTNALATTTNTGGIARTDELAFDPTRNRVIAVNNADTPPFVTVLDASTGSIVQKITFDGTKGTPNATAGGLEAPTYNPVTGKYYVAVPQIGTTGPGGLAEIDPNTLAVTRTFDFSTALGANGVCGPTGTVAGSDGRVLVGCGDNGATQTVLVDPRAGGGIKVVNGIGGEDEVAYSPSNNLYFTASRFQPGGPVLGIIDGSTGLLVQTLATTPQDHSVAVDPTNNLVFVAAGAVAGNNVCPDGCMLVYAPATAAVPEPASWAVLGLPLLGLAGLAGLRRRA